jgi:hypothetical protein
MVLVERKTFRGIIGVQDPDGHDWNDRVSGRRREEGHVLILSIHRDEFDVERLLQTLKQVDTWKYGTPLWQQAEEADERKARSKKLRRSDFIRYKASEAFDKYVWRNKQRVTVPTNIV